jgi:RES domain-containing protein
VNLVFWRICRVARAATAFDGEGARRYPGRWNHKDAPVVYCASSLSLATLELFVHVDPADIPDDLVSIRAELPGSVHVETVETKKLPTDWRTYPAPLALKDLGTEWAASMRTVGLVVPSAITPIENNLVLNPRHPDIARLVTRAPEPFAFDPRLFK